MSLSRIYADHGCCLGGWRHDEPYGWVVCADHEDEAGEQPRDELAQSFRATLGDTVPCPEGAMNYGAIFLGNRTALVSALKSINGDLDKIKGKVAHVFRGGTVAPSVTVTGGTGMQIIFATGLDDSALGAAPSECMFGLVDRSGFALGQLLVVSMSDSTGTSYWVPVATVDR